MRIEQMLRTTMVPRRLTDCYCEQKGCFEAHPGMCVGHVTAQRCACPRETCKVRLDSMVQTW